VTRIIAIVGSGTMGAGISKVLRSYGLDVSLLSARQIMAGELHNLDDLRNAELVIEASSEKLKQKLVLLKLIS